MKKELTQKEHLKKIAPTGWKGKIEKHGEEAARKKQGKYARDYWRAERKRVRQVKKELSTTGIASG